MEDLSERSRILIVTLTLDNEVMNDNERQYYISVHKNMNDRNKTQKNK